MSRSLAQQSVAELGGAGSVLARQRRDHVELDRLLRRLEAASGPEQDEVLTAVCRLVFSHAFAEEAVLWPAVRASLPDGEELTLRIEQEHQQINELVRRLEDSRHTDPGRAELLGQVVRLLDADVRDEEDLLLPRLQAALSRQELTRLGRSWEAVRRTAPTGPPCGAAGLRQRPAAPPYPDRPLPRRAGPPRPRGPPGGVRRRGAAQGSGGRTPWSGCRRCARRGRQHPGGAA
jgi:hemerythrin superfamily protein